MLYFAVANNEKDTVNKMHLLEDF